MADERSGADSHHDDGDMQSTMYLRFGAMILTGMVVMYWVMFSGRGS